MNWIASGDLRRRSRTVRERYYPPDYFQILTVTGRAQYASHRPRTFLTQEAYCNDMGCDYKPNIRSRSAG